MAKDKEFEAKYKAEGKRMIAQRKRERLAKFTKNREFRKRSTSSMCRGCGEDPYCYCGSGDPNVIDY